MQIADDGTVSRPQYTIADNTIARKIHDLDTLTASTV